MPQGVVAIVLSGNPGLTCNPLDEFLNLFSWIDGDTDHHFADLYEAGHG
jgi:hypothetical protein